MAGVEGKLHFRTCLTQTGPGLHCPPQPECPPGCLRKTGPNGEPITIWTNTEDVPGYPLPYVQCWVQIRSPDGKSAAELTLDNVLGPDGSAQTSGKLPLTLEQMLAILLEPGLML